MTVTTVLSIQQFWTEAKRFGLTIEQIAKFVIHGFADGNISITVYSDHGDSERMKSFLEVLVERTLASPVRK